MPIEERIADFKEIALSTIKSSRLLTLEDLNTVSSLSSELWESFTKSQVRRTKTEMLVSVLDDIRHPTPDSKYWQSSREQDVEATQLVMLSFEYRKNLLEIEKLRGDQELCSSGPGRELLGIEIEKREFISLLQEREAKQRIGELRKWSEIKAVLTPQLSYGTEDPDDHQLISYTSRWAMQYVAMAGNGNPSERFNLIGQLISGIRECQRRGVLPQIWERIGPTVRSVIERDFIPKPPIKEIPFDGNLDSQE